MQLNEFLGLYGEVKMKFSSYYKYTFTYKGTTSDGNTVYASIGGSADDIYKLSVSVDEEINLINLAPESGRVKDPDGNIIAELDYQGW